MLSLYGALKHHIIDYFLSITRLTLRAENTLLIKLLVPQKHRDSGDKLPSAPTMAASAVVGLSLRVCSTDPRLPKKSMKEGFHSEGLNARDFLKVKS